MNVCATTKKAFSNPKQVHTVQINKTYLKLLKVRSAHQSRPVEVLIAVLKKLKYACALEQAEGQRLYM